MQLFKQALKAAIKSHYARLTKSFDDLYGYALYTDSSLCSIGPVCNRESDLTVAESDEMYAYYKYGAVEWQHFDDFGIFNGVNTLLAKAMDCDQPQWPERRREVLDAVLSTLVELEGGGLFGSKDSGRFVAVCVTDSDDSVMEKSVRMLNSGSVYEAYVKEFCLKTL